MGMMAGCSSAAASRASRRNRSRKVRSVASSGATIFTATWRFNATCSASYTMPMPPRPMTPPITYPANRSPGPGVPRIVGAFYHRRSPVENVSARTPRAPALLLHEPVPVQRPDHAAARPAEDVPHQPVEPRSEAIAHRAGQQLERAVADEEQRPVRVTDHDIGLELSFEVSTGQRQVDPTACLDPPFHAGSAQAVEGKRLDVGSPDPALPVPEPLHTERHVHVTLGFFSRGRPELGRGASHLDPAIDAGQEPGAAAPVVRAIPARTEMPCRLVRRRVRWKRPPAREHGRGRRDEQDPELRPCCSHSHLDDARGRRVPVPNPRSPSGARSAARTVPSWAHVQPRQMRIRMMWLALVPALVVLAMITVVLLFSGHPSFGQVTGPHIS